MLILTTCLLSFWREDYAGGFWEGDKIFEIFFGAFQQDIEAVVLRLETATRRAVRVLRAYMLQCRACALNRHLLKIEQAARCSGGDQVKIAARLRQSGSAMEPLLDQRAAI